MRTKEIEKILKALGNHRRLEIIACLTKHKYIPVGDIAETINLSFRSTSRHLRILLAADILEKEQQGLQVLYYVAKNQKSFVRSILSLLP